METAGIRKFASEKKLFGLTVLIMLLMPVSELITDIIARYNKNVTPSIFQPVILGLFGLALGVMLVNYVCSASWERSWRFSLRQTN